jgi:hypothetical protein
VKDEIYKVAWRHDAGADRQQRGRACPIIPDRRVTGSDVSTADD